MSRYKDLYTAEVMPAMMKERNYSNVMEVPR